MTTSDASTSCIAFRMTRFGFFGSFTWNSLLVPEPTADMPPSRMSLPSKSRYSGTRIRK